MAAAVQVAGAAEVKIDAQQGAGLETLGYSINGVDTEERAFFSDVPGDQNGGDEGPPIAIQYFGEIAVVTMELSKWDSSVADKVRARVSDGSAGSISTAGTVLDGANSNHYRLLIDPATALPINFGFAICRNRLTMNRGTKFSRLFLEFECHAVSGTLYNTTTN